MSIKRENNDILLKSNDKSSFSLPNIDNPTNKIKMNENQSDGIS